MPLASWALWLALGALAATASIGWYRLRETPGRGRLLLALLRSASFALLLLIILDPDLPGSASQAVGGTQLLLDASLSMALPDGASTRWAAAIELAREQADDRPVLLFGDAVRPAPSPLPDSSPGDVHSRLVPALQAAAEAGAERVIVITDGGIEDAAAVARWAPRLGLDITMETVGGDVANLSLVEASGPRWAEAGTAVDFEFAVGAMGMQRETMDSVAVVARQDGRVIGRAAVPAPAPGRVANGALQLRPDAHPDGGAARIEIALEAGDAVPDDDVRALYIDIGEEPAGIAFVSFTPDWEPRFLAPVLERALGLPLSAYLQGATGQYMRLAAGLEAGQSVAEANVRRSVDRGELVVLHGLGAGAPAWAFEVAASARRLLIFPAEGGGDALPVEVGPEQGGDFWPVVGVPPSPVAPLLDGLELSGLPPLSGLRSVQGAVPPGSWAPLHVTRGRQGATFPMALGIERDSRRWVIALGSGYWQWAFRGGADRQAYARLWSALAGWLANEPGMAAGTAVRPAGPVIPRGTDVPWVTPGLAADSVAIRISDVRGRVISDTVVSGTAADTAFTRAPAPGRYLYEAAAFTGGERVGARGEFTVERYSPELARPRVTLDDIEAGARTVRGDGVTRRSGTPLHATPFPYVLLILVLAGEWILRRRWGLR